MRLVMKLGSLFRSLVTNYITWNTSHTTLPRAHFDITFTYAKITHHPRTTTQHESQWAAFRLMSSRRLGRFKNLKNSWPAAELNPRRDYVLTTGLTRTRDTRRRTSIGIDFFGTTFLQEFGTHMKTSTRTTETDFTLTHNKKRAIGPTLVHINSDILTHLTKHKTDSICNKQSLAPPLYHTTILNTETAIVIQRIIGTYVLKNYKNHTYHFKYCKSPHFLYYT